MNTHQTDLDRSHPLPDLSQLATAGTQYTCTGHPSQHQQRLGAYRTGIRQSLLGLVVALCTLVAASGAAAQSTVSITTADGTATEANMHVTPNVTGTAVSVAVTISPAAPAAAMIPFTATLSTEASADDWAVTDGSDNPVTVTSGAFNLSVAMDDTSISFNVVAADDLVWEPERTETVTISLGTSLPTGFIANADTAMQSITVTLQDSDVAPSITFTNSGDAMNRPLTEGSGYMDSISMALTDANSAVFSEDRTVTLMNPDGDTPLSRLAFQDSRLTAVLPAGDRGVDSAWTFGLADDDIAGNGEFIYFEYTIDGPRASEVMLLPNSMTIGSLVSEDIAAFSFSTPVSATPVRVGDEVVFHVESSHLVDGLYSVDVQWTITGVSVDDISLSSLSGDTRKAFDQTRTQELIRFTITDNPSATLMQTLTITLTGVDSDAGSDTVLANTDTSRTINIVRDPPAVAIVTGVAFTSTAPTSEYHGIGDTITATVTFSTAVMVTGTPTIRFAVDDQEHTVNYAGEDGMTSTMDFSYTVAAGDVDDGGIGVVANSLTATGANLITPIAPATSVNLDHDPISDDSSRKVDGVAPTYDGRAISSSPFSSNRYRYGQHIDIRLDFSEPMTVVGDLALMVEIGDNTLPVPLHTDSFPADPLVFRHTVTATDMDTDGISVPAQTLTPAASGSIADRGGNALASISVDAIAATDRHTVDGSPVVISITTPNATIEERRNSLLRVEASVSQRIPHNIRVRLRLTANTTASFLPTIPADFSSGALGNPPISSSTGEGSLSMPVTVDGVVEPEEIAEVEISEIVYWTGPNNDQPFPPEIAAPGPDNLIRFTIVDLDTATVNLLDDAITSVREGEQITVSARLSRGIQIPITVPYTLSGTGATTADTGLQELAGTINFPAAGEAQTAQVLQFTPTVDADATEHEEALVITLGTPEVLSDSITPGTNSVQTIMILESTAPLQPTNVAITSTPVVGTTYGTGESIEFTVTFEDVVNVTGSPTLPMVQVGSESRTATYASGSGTAQLVFAYPVRADDSDDNGIAVTAATIMLPDGARIDDAASTPVLLAYSLLALDADSNHRVDGALSRQPPAAPRGLIATGAVDSIELAWLPPATLTTDPPILDYRIEYSMDGNTGWMMLADTADGTTTNHTHTGLGDGTTRHYRVSARNQLDRGRPTTAAVSATTFAASAKTIEVSFGTGPYTATEGGTMADVELTLSEAPGVAIEIPLTVTSNANTSDDDWRVRVGGTPVAATNVAIPFAADATTGTVTVEAVYDTIWERLRTIADSEHTESVRVGFGTLPVLAELQVNAAADRPHADVSIMEASPRPELTVTASADRIVEDSGDTITISFSVSNGGLRDDRWLLIGLSGAEDGTDYNLEGLRMSGNNRFVWLRARQATGENDLTLTVPRSNSDVDVEKVLVVSVGIAREPDATGRRSVRITIADDDAAPPTPTGLDLTITDPSSGAVAENGTAQTVTVTAELLPSGAVAPSGGTAINMAITDDSATSSADGTSADFITITDFTITIPEGSSSRNGMFSITPTDDDLGEPPETVTVTGTATGLTAGSATLFITDGEANTPTGFSIEFVFGSTIFENVMSGTWSNPDSEAQISFLPDSASIAQDLTASWTTVDETAVAGEDYTTASGTVTINANNNFVSTTDISIPITADTLDEEDETFFIRISYPGLADLNHRMTLRDDDTVTGITVTTDVTGNSLAESAGRTEVTLTATVDGSVLFGNDQTVTVTIGDSGTTDTVDYTAPATVDIVIPAGMATGTATFILTVIDDNIDRADETLTFTAASVGSITPTNPADITLTDDDATPAEIVLTANPPLVAEGDTDAVTITITATVAGLVLPGADTTVTVTAASASTAGAVEVTLNPATFPVTIPAEMAAGTGTFTVAVTNDREPKLDETVRITGTLAGANVTGTEITVVDYEPPPTVQLSVTPATIAEAAGATMVTVTATVDGTVFATDPTVTVDLAAGAMPSVAHTLTPAQLSIPILLSSNEFSGTGMVTVTPTEDSVASGDTRIAVTGTVAEGTVRPAAIVLTDDDTATSITLSTDVSVPLAEGTTAQEVTVTATVDGGVTFEYPQRVLVFISNGGGAQGTDFTATATTLDIMIPTATPSATATTMLTVVDDSISETGETIEVRGRAYGVNVNSATIELADDDAAPTAFTLTAEPATIREDAGTTTVTVTATLSGNTTFGTPQTVTVTHAGSGATGAVATTVTPASLTITIPAAASSGSGTLTVALTDNRTEEADETITLTGATAFAAQDATATVQVVDDDENLFNLIWGTDTNGIFGWSTTANEFSGASVTPDPQVTVSGTAHPLSRISFDTTSTTLTFAFADTAPADVANLVAHLAPHQLAFADADGTSAPSYSWTVSALTPTAGDTQVFQVVQVDVDSAFASGATVPAQTWDENEAITPVVLPAPEQGNRPFRYAIDPPLPTGVQLGGTCATVLTICGAPTTFQIATTYTLTATDSDGDTATLTFTVAVEPDQPADINGDGQLTADDALILYYALRYPNLLGRGTNVEPLGEASHRDIFIGPHVRNRTDTDIQTILRSANAIAEPTDARHAFLDINNDNTVTHADALILYYALEFTELVGSTVSSRPPGFESFREALIGGLVTYSAGTDARATAIQAALTAIRNLRNR